jgi:S1-C subfamily serine protease
MTRLVRPLGAALLAITLLTGAACSDSEPVAAPQGGGTESASPAGAGQAATTAPTQVRQSNAMSTAELVAYAEPAVVRIATSTGVGTGFVVDAGGYTLTNNHVIENSLTGRIASSIEVTLSDGATYDASVVGTDARSDLALLKIDASGLKALPFADLDEVVVGQDVVAMGYALDLDGGEGGAFSVTRGIVSQKNRAIRENTQILGAIQTDAAINHGNSGGPLLNMFGQVVGVNTAIAPNPSTGTQAVGIGFAVGSDVAREVVAQLKENGRVNRGFLSISGFESLRPAKARELGIPDEGGVVLDVVTPGGPAATGGLRTGDVIVRIGDVDINTEADLAVALIRHGAGETVTVEFYRDGKKQSTEVKLGTPPN